MGILTLLLGLVKPLIDKVVEVWTQHGEKLVMYFKGRADQRLKDSEQSLKREAEDTSRISARLEAERKKRLEEQYGPKGPDDDDDPFIRVRPKKP